MTAKVFLDTNILVYAAIGKIEDERKHRTEVHKLLIRLCNELLGAIYGPPFVD